MGGERRRRSRAALTGLLAAALAAAASLLAPAPAAASPLDLFGFGARSSALAATGVASATDYDAVYLNPGGLGGLAQKRLTVGFLYGNFALSLDGRDTGTDSARGLIFGGALPIPLGGALRGRVGLGLGFYVPTNVINRARAPFPGQPTFALLESRSHVIAIQVAAGVDLGGGWGVGGGVITLAALRGFIDVSTDAAGRFTSLSEQQLITQFAPVAGVRKRLAGGRFALGLIARGESRSDYDIVVTNDLAQTLPITLPPIRIAGNAQYDPLTVAAEAAWRPRPSLQVALQAAYQRWSAYPQPVQNPVDADPPLAAADFHDTIVPRLGIEDVVRHGATELALRGGYSFVPTPAPEMTGRQSLLDNHRHVAAFGVGLSWPGKLPLRVDAWAQAHFLVGRGHDKDPSLFEPGAELPFEHVDTGGHIVVGGITIGVDL